MTLEQNDKTLQIAGFWVMLEYDIEHGTEELRLFFLTYDKILIPYVLMLNDELSIYDAFAKIEQKDVQDGLLSHKASEELLFSTYHNGKDILKTAINMLTYVCVSSFDPKSSFAKSRKQMLTMLKKSILMRTAKKSRLHIVSAMPGESWAIWRQCLYHLQILRNTNSLAAYTAVKSKLLGKKTFVKILLSSSHSPRGREISCGLTLHRTLDTIQKAVSNQILSSVFHQISLSLKSAGSSIYPSVSPARRAGTK